MTSFPPLRSGCSAALLASSSAISRSRRLWVLSLGDDEARALGVDVPRLRALVIAAATLMTASVVAISGVIGWVGLMMPHIARMLIGPNFARLLPAAMLLGAAFILAVDTLARTMARIET